MRFLEMGVKKQLGQGGCPAAVVPCGQKAGGLRRQLAKASSLILLQDDTPQTNLEFVWLNTLENHTPSAHHDFKQIENEEKKKKKKFWSFPKENPGAITKVPREVNKGKCPASIRVQFEWLLIEIKVIQCYHKPRFVKTK